MTDQQIVIKNMECLVQETEKIVNIKFRLDVNYSEMIIYSAKTDHVQYVLGCSISEDGYTTYVFMKWEWDHFKLKDKKYSNDPKKLLAVIKKLFTK